MEADGISPVSIDHSTHATRASGTIALLSSPEWLRIRENGALKLNFTLPRYGVSLVQLAW